MLSKVEKGEGRERIPPWVREQPTSYGGLSKNPPLPKTSNFETERVCARSSS